MATITREQAIKLENQAPGNWHFDWKYYVLWSEKTIYRSIETEDGGEIRAKLWYVENVEHHVNEYGCRWRTPAGHYHIEMDLTFWRPGNTPGIMVSSGFGHQQDMDHGRHPRKNYKDLCKMAETITDEDILRIYSELCKKPNGDICEFVIGG